MNAWQREILDLDGDWNVQIDPFDSGSLNYLSENRRDGWWQDRERTRPEQLIEYNFDATPTLRVPGDWNMQRDDLFFYEGTVWYRRTFESGTTPEGKRRFIWFGAANRHATVWLNGKRLGAHHVGFTPFSFEVTGKLAEGENSLVVRVDNRRRFEDVPAMRTDWWNYGGITREVGLLEVPETFISSWELRLEDGDLVGWAKLDGPGADGGFVRVSLEELGAVATGFGAEPGLRIRSSSIDGLEVWSPERPRLYNVVIQSVEDVVSDRIGFREIETEGRDVVLNGEPVFLRGICIHEESLDGGGRAWSERHARELLGLAKELGCNYVRLAHYTHNEWMTRIADELGLMVWAEIPVYWEMQFGNEVTQAFAKAHVEEMIERDRNRASVVIWSVGNENRARPVQTEFRARLAKIARELDSSRLISAACFARLKRDEDGKLAQVSVEDPFGEYADVLAINQYIGWYGNHSSDVAGMTIETAWEKPLLFSEFGAGIKQGLRGDSEEVWTEEFGVRFYGDHLDWCDELRDAGTLQGISPWILKDFRSPRRPLGGVQDWWNRKGLVSEAGVPKDVFGVVAERYRRWAEEDATRP